MSPDGLFAQLVPIVSLAALACAVVFGIAVLPRDEERSKRRAEHVQTFFGRATSEESPEDDAADVEPVVETPTWRGVDLTIFED
jgi:hypothetical protein